MLPLPLYTHHLLTSLLYQPYTPSTLQSIIQKPSISTAKKHPNTHKGHKIQQPPYIFPHLTHHSPFHSPLSATFTNYPCFYLHPNNHYTPTQLQLYRYHHQGVFYVICKQLVWHQTCEFVFANLYLQARDRYSTST
jgi:hypothetical protein